MARGRESRYVIQTLEAPGGSALLESLCGCDGWCNWWLLGGGSFLKFTFRSIFILWETSLGSQEANLRGTVCCAATAGLSVVSSFKGKILCSEPKIGSFSTKLMRHHGASISGHLHYCDCQQLPWWQYNVCACISHLMRLIYQMHNKIKQYHWWISCVDCFNFDITSRMSCPC
jgi:hypothetical protein